MNSLDGEIRGGRHHQPVRVYYEDTDFSGVVYHASYLRFMERGRTNYLRLLGADQRALLEQVEKEAPGFAFVVRSMQIDFRKPARMDDVLEIVTAPAVQITISCATLPNASLSALAALAASPPLAGSALRNTLESLTRPFSPTSLAESSTMASG